MYQLPVVQGFVVRRHTKSCLPALRETAYHLKTLSSPDNGEYHSAPLWHFLWFRYS